MNEKADRDHRSARFEALFREEYSIVSAYFGRRAEPDLVDDLVGEVFLVAWRRLDRLPAEPRAWLLTVARNVLGTHIRAARRRRALDVRLAITGVDPTAFLPMPDDDGVVAAALAALRPKDREALLLVSWEGLTPSEAASVLGERPVSFRSRLHRARTRFRDALEQPDGGPSPTESRIDQLTMPREVSDV
jgi:RNA polymerase sigma factor (sigma-70 family)